MIHVNETAMIFLIFMIVLFLLLLEKISLSLHRICDLVRVFKFILATLLRLMNCRYLLVYIPLYAHINLFQF